MILPRSVFVGVYLFIYLSNCLSVSRGYVKTCGRIFTKLSPQIDLRVRKGLLSFGRLSPFEHIPPPLMYVEINNRKVSVKNLEAVGVITGDKLMNFWTKYSAYFH